MTTPSGEPGDNAPAPESDLAPTDLSGPQDGDDSTVSEAEGPMDNVVGSLVDEMREELGGNT